MQLKDVLIKNGFHFNKRFGQNFLTDKNLLSSIVEKAGIKESDTVVEIGVGGGTLTGAIAQKAKMVIGFEIDTNLKPVLAETLKDFDNVEIIYKDIMKMPTEEIESLIGGRFSVVANLPYYITTPILMKFIEESDMVDSVTVTIQEEVADRLCAKAGSEDYGAITASIDAVGTAEKIIRIDRKMFYPAPNVDSAVVKIVMDKGKYDIPNQKAYRAGVRCAFQSRRKTLVNNIMMAFKTDRKTAEDIVVEITGNPQSRGETLSTEDFVKFSKLIVKNNLKF
ncbi:MAG: ribosomal RNA small subunit methyltransferase A [Clostridiales bacterium]|nr:ribosomal RNA small subunit methyltransferase A [Clostridiales bacterium]